MYIKNVSVKRQSYNGEVVALNGVSIDFNSRICVIYGEPGSGKTTLIESICGLEKSVKGLVSIEGNKILLTQVPERQFIYPTCLMELGFKEYDPVKKDINIMLSSVGLSPDILPLSPWQLSKGEKKRLILARIISRDIAGAGDNIFLLDDPFLDLDIAGKLIIIKRILKEQRFKIIMTISSSYDLKFLEKEAVKFKLIKLQEGRVID